MVRHRYASRACHMCKTRKVKCDETRPACQTCTKSRRQCPGYPSTTMDWVVYDQTREVQQRAECGKTYRALAQKPNTRRGVLTTLLPARQSLTSNLSPSVAELASCHFLANFVLVPHYGAARGYLEFVLPLLRANTPLLHFRYAFKACAMASFHRRIQGGNDCGNAALEYYTKALSTTFAALHDPSLCRHDATLASILLLGHFENITGQKMGIAAWGSHIEGALQLVKARGPSQLNTPIGLDLFLTVRTQMLMQIHITGRAPPMDVEWWNRTVGTDTYATHAQQLHVRAAKLRVEVNERLISISRSTANIQVMLDLIARCQAVDREFVAWSESLPAHYRWQTLAWIGPRRDGDYAKADAFPGRVDAYSDLLIAALWNMARCSRILLASMIVRSAAWVCSPADYRTTPEYTTAASTCVGIISDIIASIPCQLGWQPISENATSVPQRPKLSGFACGQDHVSKGLGGYFATWPLACILMQDYLTDPQRSWVYGRLDYIGDVLGVRYANIMTRMNIRAPSMLIRRDGLMTNAVQDFEKLLSVNPGDPPPVSFLAGPVS